MRNHHIAFTTLLILLAFTVFPLAAQITSENISYHTQLRYGPDIGVNITNMVSDTLDYESAWLPSLGFGIHYEYKERAGIKASALYGIRGTNVQSPFFKYRVSYMELVIGGFYKPVSFGGIEAGYNFAFMSNANKIVTSSQSASGTSRIPVGGFGNNHHPYAGIFIQLTENSAISFRYGIPVKNIDFSSCRIGFNYYLGTNNYKKKTVAEEIALEEVHQKIITLRNGVLLVRIPTGRNSIEVLDSLGFHKKARSVENEAIAEQQEIMDAFDVFNFCDVYFFYDYNTPKIINKEYTGTLLVNRKELLYHPLDSALPVFIAEFGNYKKGEVIMHNQHDFQYLKDHDIHPDSIDSYIVYRDQGLGVGGLVVMDDRFNIIPEPFPSYIKMYNATLFRNARKKIDAVRILHEQCMNLYKEAIIQKGIPSP